MNINEQANFIWSIADLLRGDFKQSEYGKVILPFTVLRRFDCVLAPSKAKILEANKTLTVSNKRPIFKRMTGHDYYNISQFDFEKLMDDSNAIEANLRDYINGFSEDVREIMDNFEIFGVIDKLSRANLLYLVVQRFAEIDMSDTQIDNLEMFSGDAGSGESEIRRWIIENDLLEAIIGLPDQLFYNTGITTYIWILTNRKENRRKGKVRLINGAGFYEKMRKGLGNKRNMISPENRAEIVRLYSTYEPDENYMDLDNDDFGYRKIVVERPLLNEDGTPVTDRKGNRKADASLRDYEIVPLKEDIHEYFRREVLPFVPDAWIDESKTKIGYEIPFTRYFYKFTPLRDSSVIMEDIKALEARIQTSLAEVFEE